MSEKAKLAEEKERVQKMLEESELKERETKNNANERLFNMKSASKLVSCKH